MEELKTVKLLGAAGRKFKREIRLAVKSPAEAVRALMVLFPEFKAWVLEQHQRGVGWRVITEPGRSLGADDLKRETGAEVIVLAPVLQGAGGNGFWQILAGIALIAIAVIVPFGAVGGGLGLGLLGGSLVLGGIAQMITPTPVLSGSNANDYSSGTEASNSADLESNLFSRGQGTGAQGECVPLLYGRRRVTSPRLVSFDLRNYPGDRAIDVSSTAGLLGYVAGVDL